MRQVVREELAFMIKNKKLVFPFPIQILDGNDITIGQTTGTRIGTTADQKLAFLGATPIAKQTGVLRNVSIDPTSDPAGWDVYARAGVQSINTALTNLGLATY